MGRARLRQHIVELLKLAAPVIVARAGLMVMSAVDILIVARYSSEELAYLGLGTLPASMLVTAGIGMLLGTMILTSHAVGAGRFEECGPIWRRSLPYALLIGILAALASLLGEPFFRLTGQEPDVAEGGARVLAVLGAGLPAAMLYAVSAFFLEGLKRPLPGMVVMIAANLLNVPLNFILVWGAWGIPAMGAEGSAWATTTVRWMLALSLLAYVWNLGDRSLLRIRLPAGQWWRGAAHQRRLGYAAGASLALESSAFSILGLFAGMVGPLALGAYTISLNLIALPFMTAVGLASATGVRVGVAYGRRDRHDVVMAGWTGLGRDQRHPGRRRLPVRPVSRTDRRVFHVGPAASVSHGAAGDVQRLHPDSRWRAGGHGERAAGAGGHLGPDGAALLLLLRRHDSAGRRAGAECGPGCRRAVRGHPDRQCGIDLGAVAALPPVVAGMRSVYAFDSKITPQDHAQVHG